MSLSEFELVELLEGRKQVESISPLERVEALKQSKQVAAFLSQLERDPKAFTRVDVLQMEPDNAILRFGFEYQGYRFPAFTLTLDIAADAIKPKTINWEDGSPLGSYFGRKKFYLEHVAGIALDAMTNHMKAGLGLR